MYTVERFDVVNNRWNYINACDCYSDAVEEKEYCERKFPGTYRIRGTEE